jgi:DNA uptake protein ComE-like DNA-binding protein
MMLLHFWASRYAISTEFYLKKLDLEDSLHAWHLSTGDTLQAKPFKLSPFDPNDAPYDSLVAMGIISKVAQNIVSYRKAGGSFETFDDLKKIYGMTDSLWELLHPWVKLGASVESNIQTTEHPPERKRRNNTTSNSQKKDLNHADSAWFQTIYGIGPVLSSRIVRYRSLLGGFVSLDQLHEVYGLAPEVIQRLLKKAELDTAKIPFEKINVNRSDHNQLAAHPYLSFIQARAIVAYRDQHGLFNTIEELKKIHLMDDSTYLRVSPYLDF